MVTAKSNEPGSGTAGGRVDDDAIGAGGPETVCGETAVGVAVGVGGVTGNAGALSNWASAGERLGWYDRNRCGSRLRLQSR